MPHPTHHPALHPRRPGSQDIQARAQPDCRGQQRRRGQHIQDRGHIEGRGPSQSLGHAHRAHQRAVFLSKREHTHHYA